MRNGSLVTLKANDNTEVTITRRVVCQSPVLTKRDIGEDGSIVLDCSGAALKAICDYMQYKLQNADSDPKSLPKFELSEQVAFEVAKVANELGL